LVRSYRTNGVPSTRERTAVTMCELTETAFSVSPAACVSPNTSAALLFLPMTSASMPVSRTSRCRELEASYINRMAVARSNEAVLVTMPIAVSLRASDKFLRIA
jgi:hypothetical protein